MRATSMSDFAGRFRPGPRRRSKEDASTWEMPVTGDVRILFLHLDTDAHFTNFKPAFMLETLGRSQTEAVLYCDPDVVVNTTWRYVEEWLSCGVGLCDDVNSPLAENHPRRVGWRRFFQGSAHELRFRGSRYANDGVVGIPRIHARLRRKSGSCIARRRHRHAGWRAYRGHRGPGPDGRRVWLRRLLSVDRPGHAQCRAGGGRTKIPLSFLGRQAMGFDAGTPFFSHSVGPVKPWSRGYLRDAMGGKPPVRVDKIFWNAADGPLEPFSVRHLATTRWRITFAAALGRLMRRS